MTTIMRLLARSNQGGGLVSIWNSNLFIKDHVFWDECIIVQGRWMDKNIHICFMNVHASQSPIRKESLWEFLSTMIDR